MKWNCELIQDLLPLYEEGLCSSSSRRAVEEHLRECEGCRRLSVPLPASVPEETPAADRAVTRSIKKVKRRWLTSLIAAMLAVPMLLLSINQYRGYGLCFTNLDEVCTAWRFLNALQTQDWEKAAGMHDFSDAYDSILEALGMDVSDWGVSFTPCGLSGYDYAAKRYLAQTDAVPETVEELYGFLYNRTGSAMVPLALWEQMMTMEPDAFCQEGWQYWLNGERYGKITTEWGDFVVSEGRGYDTAYDYATHFDLIPAAIYGEAKPAIEANALQLYSSTHADIGWVAELTEAEFLDEMTRRYTAELRSLDGTVTFDCTGYRSAYRIPEGGWRVRFAVTITRGSKTLDTEIDLAVENGRIFVVGISHDPGADWLDEIDRALYPSAHAGY